MCCVLYDMYIGISEIKLFYEKLDGEFILFIHFYYDMDHKKVVVKHYIIVSWIISLFHDLFQNDWHAP